MSRGPGTLGRRILAELEAAPGGRLQWRLLKQRFPRQVEDKGFYASIRSLKRLGRILDHGEGDTRYIYLAPVYHAGGPILRSRLTAPLPRSATKPTNCSRPFARPEAFPRPQRQSPHLRHL
jgi:hypothetical protein